MPLSGKYTKSFQTLFTEVKCYLELQKKYIAMETAEKLTILLSTVAIAVTCLTLGAMILFFTSFALAYWIGEAVGSLAFGFAVIGIALALLLILFYCKRGKWVIQPLARFVISVFAGTDNTEKEEGK